MAPLINLSGSETRKLVEKTWELIKNDMPFKQYESHFYAKGGQTLNTKERKLEPELWNNLFMSSVQTVASALRELPNPAIARETQPTLTAVIKTHLSNFLRNTCYPSRTESLERWFEPSVNLVATHQPIQIPQDRLAALEKHAATMSNNAFTADIKNQVAAIQKNPRGLRFLPSIANAKQHKAQVDALSDALATKFCGQLLEHRKNLTGAELDKLFGLLRDRVSIEVGANQSGSSAGETLKSKLITGTFQKLYTKYKEATVDQNLERHQSIGGVKPAQVRAEALRESPSTSGVQQQVTPGRRIT
jgi:hypothetical protein